MYLDGQDETPLPATSDLHFCALLVQQVQLTFCVLRTEQFSATCSAVPKSRGRFCPLSTSLFRMKQWSFSPAFSLVKMEKRRNNLLICGISTAERAISQVRRDSQRESLLSGQFPHNFFLSNYILVCFCCVFISFSLEVILKENINYMVLLACETTHVS